MEGIILAAGLGSRLRSISRKPKFAIELDGRPLIYYPLSNMFRIGLDRILVVVNMESLEYMYDIVDKLEFKSRIEIIVNENPEKGNAYSLLKAAFRTTDENFLLSMSDHIYPTKVLERILTYRKKFAPDADVIVGGDSLPRFIDIEEATKILADEKYNMVDIGKDLVEYTHVDVGVSHMSRRIIRYTQEYFTLHFQGELSMLLKWFKNKGMTLKVCDIEGVPWKDIDTPEDLYMILSGDYRVVLDIWKRGR